MGNASQRKTCPYCKESVHVDAIKCKFCQSMLIPVAADEGGGGDTVTYVLDRGLVRFAKFALAILGIFTVVGLYFFGFNLERTADHVREVNDHVKEVNHELKTEQAEMTRLHQEMRATQEALRATQEEIDATKADVRKLQQETGRYATQALEASKKADQSLRNILAMESEAVDRMGGIRDLTLVEDRVLARLRALRPELFRTEEASRIRGTGVAYRTKLWKAGESIRVAFLDGEAAARDRVAEIARRWTEHANLSFEFVDSPREAQVRITLEQPGGWSFVGTDCLIVPSPQPTMSLGSPASQPAMGPAIDAGADDDQSRRAVLYNFGLAIGLLRADLNPMADIPWDRAAIRRKYADEAGWTEQMIDQNFFAKPDPDDLVWGEFSTDSIMMIAVPDELTVGDYKVDPRSDLSEGDKLFVSALYPAE